MTVDNFRFVHQAIKLINPIAEYVIRDSSDSPNIDNDTCTIEWHKGDAISKSDIKTKVDELQVEYDAQDYARQRDAEYPSIKDQLDKIYHEGIDKWKEDMIKPVKDKYPKE